MRSSCTHLLLGLGNDLLRDDSIGLRVVRTLRPRLAGRADWSVVENGEGGLSLLDAWSGCDEICLVDAVRTGRRPVGWVHRWAGDDLPRLVRGSMHAMGVGEVLALGRLLGLPMPRWLTVLGIEVVDAETLDTDITAAMRSVLPLVVERVWAVVLERLDSPGAAPYQAADALFSGMLAVEERSQSWPRP
jgi:hydrogenase maturation protease